MFQEVYDGQMWGRWVYRRANNTLLIEEPVQDQYAVHLDPCTNQVEVLDWIVQVSSELWATENDIGHLVRAMEACLGIRGLPRTPEDPLT